MTNGLKWKIGDVTITKIVETEFELDMPELVFPRACAEEIKANSWLIPDYSTYCGAFKMSIHALLIETPNQNVIVDTCVGNNKTRLVPEWNRLSGDFLDKLSKAGCPRESISAVLCTHMHVDHVGWNTMLEDGKWVPTFPNATYYFGRVEYEHWMAIMSEEKAATKATLKGGKEVLNNFTPKIMRQDIVFEDSIQPIIDAELEELVEMDARLSPEISLIPTIGHTPGHISVVIESKGSKAIITGDIIHHPSQIAFPKWGVIFDYDFDQAMETRENFLVKYANSDTLVIGTHFTSPTGGYIVSDGTGYRLEKV